MYKITTPTGETFLTEKPNFICEKGENRYLTTSQEQADGVAYNGKPYLYKDGTMCHEVDSGEIYMGIENAIKEGLRL